MIFTVIVAFMVVLLPLALVAARRMIRAFRFSRIPKLLGEKLTRDALMDAACRHTPFVLLPGAHGLLVTDPRLARRLLESSNGSVIRDISAYERYSAFLGGSLVLLAQATNEHRAMRSALLPLFSLSATRRAHGTLLECTQRLLEALEAGSKPGRAAPLYRLLQVSVMIPVPALCNQACYADRLISAPSALCARRDHCGLLRATHARGRPQTYDRSP